MGFSDVVRWAEHRINSADVKAKSRRGWVPQVSGFTGYGNAERARVLGRVLMADPNREPKTEVERGYRQFFTTQVPNIAVTVELGDQRVTAQTDRNGYLEVLILDHGLTPGWHTATVRTPLSAEATEARVQIIADDVTHGLISDVDDTIMVTMLPRAMLAAWNSWVKKTNTRQPVPGMRDLYAELLAPDEPTFYVSTGAWNTFDTLTDFIAREQLPPGPLLLTDWGPTPTGLFRSGQEHKRVALRNLIVDFPNIRWTLVGDDGQHDPMLYSDLVQEHPDRVRLVAIRELSRSEHMLAHGTTATISQPGNYRTIKAIHGHTGFDLLREFKKL